MKNSSKTTLSDYVLLMLAALFFAWVASLQACTFPDIEARYSVEDPFYFTSISISLESEFGFTEDQNQIYDEVTWSSPNCLSDSMLVYIRYDNSPTISFQALPDLRSDFENGLYIVSDPTSGDVYTFQILTTEGGLFPPFYPIDNRRSSGSYTMNGEVFINQAHTLQNQPCDI